MNYFHCLVLASLAFEAVSSRGPPTYSSSINNKGKPVFFDPVALASNNGAPETLYRHQLEPYKSQDAYSRGQGQLYQRSVPHVSQQQNIVGHPQQYYQQEAEGGPPGPHKYYSQAGPPPSSQVKYYPVKQHASSLAQYNRPQIQYNIGKPGAEGFQPKHPYAKAPQFSQATDVSSFSYKSPSGSYDHESSYNPYSGQDRGSSAHKSYPIQYQTQEGSPAVPKNHQEQYQRPEQSPQITKYSEQAQKQFQEALNFQKSRLNQASAAFSPHHQPQYQESQQHQQYVQHDTQHQQYTQEHEQQQSEQIPESAQHFYEQYLQMVNKQGFIQAPSGGEDYQQQQYQNLEGQQSKIQEIYARPTKFLASGQVLSYKESDLQGI